MDELLEHEATPDLDDRPDLPQRQPGGGLQGRLQGLRQRLAPLPEDAWIHRQPIQDEADPQATETSDHGDGSLFDPSATDGSTGSTSATGSFRRGSAKLYGVLAAAAAGAVTGIVNWRMKQDPDDRTWLMTKEEAVSFGKPVGRIMARHAPLPIAEGETTDVFDALDAGIVLVDYMLRSLMERAEKRQGPQAPNPMQQTEQAA